MSHPRPGTALVTGASSGIGAVYADRLGHRGYDLVLVARDAARLDARAAHLRSEAGVQVEVLVADLARREDLLRVEQRLSGRDDVTLLVNNAGIVGAGTFIDQTPEDASAVLDLNVTALTRLASAVTPRFVKAGRGAIINIASVVGLAPEFGMATYGATKAYVLFLSQALALELGPKGVQVQAVLPAATRTEIWERSGRDVDKLANVMAVDELVDAALVGFDKGEVVTIPPLAEEGQWTAFDQARRAMLPNLGNSHAALRYRSA